MSQTHSILRFAGRSKDDNGTPLHWGRAGVDGLPFRGEIPQYTAEEYEEVVRRVGDPKNGTFDTGDPIQNRAYMEAYAKCIHGWATSGYVHRWIPEGKTSIHIYFEWVEWYMEDGKSSRPVQAPRSNNGQGIVPGAALANPFAQQPPEVKPLTPRYGAGGYPGL
jgi:hypothetical protein